MSTNFRNSGQSIKFIAPGGGVLSGVGLIIANMFAVPANTTDAGKEFIGDVQGTFEFPAVGGDVGIAGTLVYWDDAAKNVTLTASSNKIIGAYADDKANGELFILVRLNGITFA